MFVTTTIAVIYFTVFVQGITVKPLVKFLNVKRASKKKPTMNERIHERVIHRSRRKCESSLLMFFQFQVIDHLMAGVEDIIGKTGNYNVRDKFKRFDNRFIRPLILKNIQVGSKPRHRQIPRLAILIECFVFFTDGRAENSGNLFEIDDEGRHGFHATEPINNWSNVKYWIDERSVSQLHGRRV